MFNAPKRLRLAFSRYKLACTTRHPLKIKHGMTWGLLGLLFLSVSSLAETSGPIKELVLGAAESPEESPQMKRTEKILKQAFSRIGYEVTLKHLPAARSLHASNSGAIDGEAQRIYHLNRSRGYTLNNLLRVPEPHQSASLVAYVYDRENLLLDPDDPWQTLKSLRVAAKHGIVDAEQNMARVGAEHYESLADYGKMFHMLQQGRVDVVIALEDEIKPGGLLTKPPFAGAPFKKLPPSLTENPLYVYLHKQHEAIVPKVSAALQAMRAEGSLQAIAQGR